VNNVRKKFTLEAGHKRPEIKTNNTLQTIETIAGQTLENSDMTWLIGQERNSVSKTAQAQETIE